MKHNGKAHFSEYVINANKINIKFNDCLFLLICKLSYIK